jgi:hypothetical protein
MRVEIRTREFLGGLFMVRLGILDYNNIFQFLIGFARPGNKIPICFTIFHGNYQNQFASCRLGVTLIFFKYHFEKAWGKKELLG